MLELRGLTKAFGALVVADAVSLSVMPGECHALIGPNGAGKTTLVHQVAGMLAPDSGQVLQEGQDVTAMPAYARARRGLARTFQVTSVISGLDALGNVALAAQAKIKRPLSPFRAAASDEHLNAASLAALRQVGLSARPHVMAEALSHGERRALEVAMALVSNPRLILLDEPLAGMGFDESRAMVALLARLKGSVAMLLVEHDMDAVFALADRVSVLVAGRIIATGSPEEMRADVRVRAAYLGHGDGKAMQDMGMAGKGTAGKGMAGKGMA